MIYEATPINHDKSRPYTIDPLYLRSCAAERAPTLLRAAPAALRAEREVEMFAVLWGSCWVFFWLIC